jgi:putative phosphoribosyl transferase
LKKSALVVPIQGIELNGDLTCPDNPRGLVIFAHGSGSSRFSPRNNYVADKLNQAGFATFLFDLLTEDEERVDVITREYRFDIPRLAERLITTTQWINAQPSCQALSIGLFGSSTGAAAALIAAAQLPELVTAVVSRGGRPDLAKEHLPQVNSDTLLIVGGWDDVVIALNNDAKQQMIKANVELTIVPEATHLFEETGKLDEVIQLVIAFFKKQLKSPR